MVLFVVAGKHVKCMLIKVTISTLESIGVRIMAWAGIVVHFMLHTVTNFVTIRIGV